MKRHMVFFGAIVALVISDPASAQDRTGFAIHAGIGSSGVYDDDGSDEFSATDVGGLLGVEYRFTDHFALGMNYFNLGRPNDFFDGADTSIKVKGLDLVGRIILPVSDKTEVYGLIGGATYTADLIPGGNNGLFGEDAWEFGAGLDFNTSEDFAIRLEGRYFRGPRDESGSLVTIGFSYRF
ncbi:MAG: porin family protein [Gammaproteobacteria bacterium]|nr:porin family protein [Gammaproteobacteria bacterium]